MFIPRLAVAILAASLFSLTAAAQTDFTYRQYQPASGSAGYVSAANAHLADFNGDGLADVLRVNGYPAGVDLYLNNGSGGLDAPRALPVNFLPAGIAVSDFNGDGHIDIALLSPSGTVVLLYGHGDGTFDTPVSIQLPFGQYTSLVEADFDDNNTQDLAALDKTGNLMLLFNNGKGQFSRQQARLDTPASGLTTTGLVVGDFNGDGRPDLAWVENGDIGSQGSTVWSALNTSTGVFSSRHLVGSLPIGSGNVLAADLDLDGKTDLITWATQLTEYCCSEYPVSLYYSAGNGTFTGKFLDYAMSTDIGVTDINGDGIPDVVVSGNAGLTVYLGKGSRTFAGQGTYALPGGSFPVGFGFNAADNRMGLATTNSYSPVMSGNGSFLYDVFNNNAQGDCAYPATAGISFCSAVQNGMQVHVRGTARAQTQPVRHIELWANGKKVYQVFSDEFDATLSLAAGTKITAVEVDANGTARQTTTSTASSASCAAPRAAGVNVCSPAAGAGVSSPVDVIAAATGASGSVNHLELWIDGHKIGNYSGSTMNARVALAPGTHVATVVEDDSRNAFSKSNPVTFTVK